MSASAFKTLEGILTAPGNNSLQAISATPVQALALFLYPTLAGAGTVKTGMSGAPTFPVPVNPGQTPYPPIPPKAPAASAQPYYDLSQINVLISASGDSVAYLAILPAS